LCAGAQESHLLVKIRTQSTRISEGNGVLASGGPSQSPPTSMLRMMKLD